MRKRAPLGLLARFKDSIRIHQTADPGLALISASRCPCGLRKHRSQLPSSVRPFTVSNSRSKGWAYQKAVTSRMLTPASANGMHIVSLLDSVE